MAADDANQPFLFAILSHGNFCNWNNARNANENAIASNEIKSKNAITSKALPFEQMGKAKVNNQNEKKRIKTNDIEMSVRRDSESIPVFLEKHEE